MIKRLLNKIENIYKYRYFSKNEDGAYQFLLKKIYKSTDIDFLENIWKLDYYREVLEPKSLELSNYNKVLVLAPHQDDEIIGCGGTLVKLFKNNCDISIGFLTNGSELTNPKESILIRNKEAQLVCDKLNIKKLDLGIDNIDMIINNDHINNLKSWLNEDWDAVFSIWPLDQPPKHRICSYFLGKVLKTSNFNGDLLFYSVHTDLLPNYYSDISEVIEDKQELLSTYKSQLRAKRYDHFSKGLDAWRSRLINNNTEPKFIETFMKIPVEAYIDFQSVYEKVKTNELFKANEVCVKSFSRLKNADF